MKDVVILIPTLGRPQHIDPLLDSLYNTTDRASVLFLLTPGDLEVKKKILSRGEDIIEVRQTKGGRGDYARKINIGYKSTKEPVLFLGATDLIFHDNWLENAMSHLSETIQVVGTNDLGNGRVMKGEHSTHTLVTRRYVDKFGTVDEVGKVLHEGYPHEYVDDEFIQTAQCRDAFAMALDSHVEHMHPAWNKAEWDASYKEVNKRLELGYRHFKRRVPLWKAL